MLKVWCVCGCGLGSSFALEMTAKPVLKELELDAEVDHTTVSDVLSKNPDLILTSSTFAEAIKSSASEKQAKRIITINKFTDKKEMEEKIAAFAKEHGLI